MKVLLECLYIFDHSLERKQAVMIKLEVYRSGSYFHKHFNIIVIIQPEKKNPGYTWHFNNTVSARDQIFVLSACAAGIHSVFSLDSRAAFLNQSTVKLYGSSRVCLRFFDQCALSALDKQRPKPLMPFVIPLTTNPEEEVRDCSVQSTDFFSSS